MKISQQTISIIGVLFILGLVLAKGPIISWEQSDSYENHFTPQQTEFTRINDEINQTEKRLDSLNYKKSNYINEGYEFLGWTFDKLGIGKIKKSGMYFADTVVYLKLGNIGVDVNEKIGKSFLFYYEKNGQGFLSRTKLVGNYKETVETYENGKLISREGNRVIFIDKKVDYKYFYRDKSMLVPLRSKVTETIATIAISIFGFLQFALAISILSLFFRFLMFIARNNAFEEGNIQRLKYMSIAFFILAVNTYIINGIIYLIFISQYSSEGVIFTYSFWEWDYAFMICAILCYLLYTAFRKAMTLQQENELTI